MSQYLCPSSLPDFPGHGEPECLTIEVGGLVFTGTHQRDAYYGITAVPDGWLTGADARGGPLPYESADGGYQARVDMQGRNITIEGVIEATTRQELWEMADALGKVLVAERWGDMIVTEEALGLQRQLSVCRLRAPRISYTGWTSAVFTLELQSASYPKLDAVESSIPLKPGDSLTASNDGDYPSEVRAILTGPLVTPIITVGGGTVGLSMTIAAGKTIEIDFARRVVRDPATALQYRREANGTWPTLDPGSQRVALWAGAGSTGSVELRWRSAWT